MHTAHSTLYTAHCKLHTAHLTLYTAHFTLNTVHFALYTTHFILLMAHSTLNTAQCILKYPILNTEHSKKILTLYTANLKLHKKKTFSVLYSEKVNCKL